MLAGSSAGLGLGEPAAQPATAAQKKKIVERVPAETQQIANVIPAAAMADEGERVIAVEEVPDEAPAQTAAVAEPEAAAPAETSAPLKGWSVQLASAASEDAAWSVWKKMKARNKALESKDPVVVRADLGTKGIFFRVRLVGFDSQSEASGECSKLKSRGVKCFVSKAAS